MWTIKNGERHFLGGRGNYQLAEQAAVECGKFLADEEEEFAADEMVSCYNCRYRRWTPDGFMCMKKQANKI